MTGVRRLFKAWNVPTILAVGGLLLSIAALLVVTGIGQTQIVASESRHADLYNDWWFDVGLAVAVGAVLVIATAIAAMSTQAAARRAFPDLYIQVLTVAKLPTETAKHFRRAVILRVSNQEARRVAVLDVFLQLQLEPLELEDETRWAVQDMSMRPQWLTEILPDLDSQYAQLRTPIHVGPQMTAQGFLMFDYVETKEHIKGATPTVEILDVNSGTYARLQALPGQSHGELDHPRPWPTK